MKIETRRTGTIAVLVPDGSITIGETADAFRGALEGAIASGASHVVLDGSRVRFMDSTGIGELIAARRRLTESAGKVGIASPSPKLREILEITGLSAIFVVGEHEEDVVGALSSPSR